nr:polyprotein [Meccus longipennis virus 1]
MNSSIRGVHRSNYSWEQLMEKRFKKTFLHFLSSFKEPRRYGNDISVPMDKSNCFSQSSGLDQDCLIWLIENEVLDFNFSKYDLFFKGKNIEMNKEYIMYYLVTLKSRCTKGPYGTHYYVCNHCGYVTSAYRKHFEQCSTDLEEGDITRMDETRFLQNLYKDFKQAVNEGYIPYTYRRALCSYYGEDYLEFCTHVEELNFEIIKDDEIELEEEIVIEPFFASVEVNFDLPKEPLSIIKPHLFQTIICTFEMEESKVQEEEIIEPLLGDIDNVIRLPKEPLSTIKSNFTNVSNVDYVDAFNTVEQAIEEPVCETYTKVVENVLPSFMTVESRSSRILSIIPKSTISVWQALEPKERITFANLTIENARIYHKNSPKYLYSESLVLYNRFQILNDIGYILETEDDIGTLELGPKAIHELCYPKNKCLRQRRSFTMAINRRKISKPVEVVRCDFELVRHPRLLAKLRLLIQYYQLLRSGASTYENFSEYYKLKAPWYDRACFVEPQMADKQNERVEEQASSNVVLTTTNEASKDQASLNLAPVWHNYASTEQNDSFVKLEDRDTYWQTIEWDVNHVEGAKLGVSYDLPKAFVDQYKKAKCSMPICVPFNIHRYWRGDIRIRLQLNSNKFQVGQLQASWLYMQYADKHYSTSIFSRSQMPHVLLNAGSSNSATLIIPYKHVRPYLHTKQRKGYTDYLNLGTLEIRVVVPLQVADKGPKNCNLSMYIAFENCNFTGMVDGQLVEPQMETAIGMMAATALYDKVIGTTNCDNRTSTSVAPYLVPTASHSWCLGQGLLEQTQTLRLQNIRGGVGRLGETDFNELDNKTPCSIFGMLQHFTWSAKTKDFNKSGKLLWACDASPLVDKINYYSSQGADGLEQYAIPPIGVVSSLHQYWRGGIEFRFDIVCSQFHTGRLLVAYIPGISPTTIPTLAQARNSAHAIFDLQDTNSFGFHVPYIADKPWWYRRYSGPQRRSEVQAPSRLFIFILNPLIPMESVVSTVTIVPYMRAASDFELAVPVQPSIGLSYEARNVIPDLGYTIALTGYEPYYAGSWRSFQGGKKMILRYGAGSDHIAQFRPGDVEVKPGGYVVWELQGDKKNFPYITLEAKQVPIQFGVLWYYEGYVYMIPFTDKAKAESCASAMACKKDWAQFTLSSELEATSTYSTGGPLKWRGIVYDPACFQMERASQSKNTLAPTSLLPSTNSGAFMFGEKYTSQKDILRRYQLLWTGRVFLDKSRMPGDAILQWTAAPQGLNLDINNPNQIWNALRDGATPIILNGYMFYRGGLRYRLVFPADFNENVWVQHHPDMPCDGNLIMKVNNQIHYADRFKNHNYGYYIQSTRVNNIVEFEVPFYQPGLFGLARIPVDSQFKTDLSDFIGLGDVVVGVQSTQIKDLDVQVYYSVADDFSCNVFKGYDPMVLCDEVWEKREKTIHGLDIEYIEAEPQMMRRIQGIVDYLPEKMTNMFADKVTTTINTATDNIVNNINDTQKMISQDMKSWVKTTGYATLFSNLLHVLVNPCPYQIATAVGNIIVTLIGVSMKYLFSIIDILNKIFQQNWSIFMPTDKLKYVSPQMAGDEKDYFKELASLIMMMVAMFLGKKFDNNKKKDSTYFDFMRNISVTASLHNNILIFLRNTTDCVKHYMFYLITSGDEKAKLERMLADNSTDIATWYKECQFLLDKRNDSRYVHDMSMIDRVFHACNYGNILVEEGLTTSIKNNTVSKALLDTVRDVNKLKSDLIEQGKHPDVRFECFPLYIWGPPGIGKSFLTTRLSKDLLSSINYSGTGSMIYYLEPGKKHWNAMPQDPAVIVRDDAFQVGGQFLEEELANLFSIVSSCVLNPPQADLTDKKRRINPLIYLMLANNAFPHIEAANNPQAVYRRRKCLIETRIKPHILEDYSEFIDASQIDDNLLRNLDHLEFRFAKNPKNVHTEYDDWMCYDQMICILKHKFKFHYETECENFKQRVRDMYACDPSFNEHAFYKDIPEIDEVISIKEKQRIFEEYVNARLVEMEDPLMKEDKTLYEKFVLKWYDIKKDVQERFTFQNETTGIEDFHLDKLFEEAIDKSLPNTCSALERLNVVGDEEDVKFERNTPSEEELRAHYLCYNEDPIPFIEDVLYNTGLHENTVREILAGYDSYPTFRHLMQVACHLAVKDFTVTPDNKDFRMSLPLIRYEMGFALKNSLCIPFFPLSLYNSVKAVRNLCTGNIDGLERLSTPLLYWPAIFQKDAQCAQPVTKQDRMAQLCVFLQKTFDVHYNTKAREKAEEWFALTLPERVRALQHSGDFVDDFLSYFSPLSSNNNRKAISPLVLSGVDLPQSWRQNLELVNFLAKDRILCEHDKFWRLALSDMGSVSYCKKQKEFKYRLNLGRTITCSHSCKHKNSLSSNPLVRKMIHLIATNTVKNIDCCVDKSPQILSTVLDKIGINLQNWWNHYIPKALTTVVNFVIRILPTLIATLLTALTSWLAFQGLVWGIKKTIPIPDTPYQYEGNNYFKFDLPNKPKVATVNSTHIKTFQNSQQREVIKDKLLRNSCILHCTYVDVGKDTRSSLSGRCIVLEGRKMLVLRHYLEEFRYIIHNHSHAQFTLFYRMGGQQVHRSIDAEELLSDVLEARSEKLPNSNYCIIQLPVYIPPFKDITNLFASASQHSNIPAYADIYALNDKPSYDIPLKSENTPVIVSAEDHISDVYMERTYTYSRQYKGLCGAAVVVGNLNNGNGAIVGFHVAGGNGRGIAEPLYLETVEQLTGHCKRKDPKVILPKVEEIDVTTINFEGNFLAYGKIDPKYAHTESGKTKYIPSPLAGSIYSVKTEPNPLKPNDPRQPPGSDPLRDGCKKHGSGDIRPFSKQILDMVEVDQFDTMHMVNRPVRANIGILTDEQAICGDINVPYFESLNWKSSEGFPLSSERPIGAHDKRWLFDLEETDKGYKLLNIHDKLKLHMRLRDECFNRNIVPVTIYIDCLKDYRLTPEKCAIPGKTRIFSIAPIQNTLDCKKYLGDFCAAYKQNRIDNSSGIGINPDSLEWTKLVTYLTSVGHNIIFLDYKNFGPTLMSQVVDRAYNGIVEWYRYNGASEEHINRVEWLRHELLNPLHLYKDILYQTLDGIASGSPITSELNSECNQYYIKATYLEIMLMRCPELATMNKFHEHVRFVVYGDDVIMSVSDEAILYFNGISIQEQLSHHGILVTSAFKDKALAARYDLTEATFLKRGFKTHPFRAGVWLAPIEQQSVEECLNWIHVGFDENEALLEVVRSSLDLAYGLGPEYFKLHLGKIQRGLTDLGLVFRSESWYERDRKIFQTEDISLSNKLNNAFFINTYDYIECKS